MAHVCLRGHEQLQRHVLGAERCGERLVRLVEGRDVGAEMAGRALDVLHGNELGAGGLGDGLGGQMLEWGWGRSCGARESPDGRAG